MNLSRLLSVLFCTVSLLTNAETLTLTDGGKSYFQIQSADPKDPHAQLAAKELGQYIEKISGAKTTNTDAPNLRIHILLASLENAPASLPPEMVRKLKDSPFREAFYIKTIHHTIYIVGKTPLGMLFGAYEFLQKHLGVRWLYPGETGEVCPENPNLTLTGIDDFQEPGMSPAGFWYYSTYENRKVPWKFEDTTRWLLRNKIRPGYVPSESDPVIRAILPPKPTLSNGGHLTFEQAVPAEKYYAEHPEYYPLINGVRVRPTGHDKGQRRAQLCVSNPEVKKLVTEYILRFTRENPEHVFRMGASDAPDMWCRCPNCIRMGTGSDGIFRTTNLYHKFYSEISSEVLKKNPAAKLYAYIYLDYRDLPTVPIHYDDRVTGCYCAHGRCIAHPLDDPSCEMNHKYLREYLAWKKILKRTSLGDYYFNSNVPYCPHEYVFAADIGTRVKRGDDAYGTHITPFRIYTNWQFIYTIARMNWDPTLDIDALMENVYSRYYGKASGPMKKYHAMRKELWKNAPGHAWYPGPNRGAYCLVLPESEKKLRSYLAEAEKLAGNDSRLQARIAIEKENFENIWSKDAEAIRKQLTEKRIVPAKRISGEIRIDGKLDEPEWKQAEVLNSFVSAVSKGRLAEETNVRVLYDDHNWYVSMECMNDKGITPLKAACRQRDGGVSQDDSVEFFIAPPGNTCYYHFIVNSLGTFYDAKLTDKTYDSKAEIRTSVDKDRYIVEARIPIQPMGLESIRDGQIWQAHFWRTIRNLLPPADMDRGGVDGVWPHRQNEFRQMPTGQTVIRNGAFTMQDARKGFASFWGVIRRGEKPTAKIVDTADGRQAVKMEPGGQIYQHFSLLQPGVEPKGYEINGEIIASGKGQLLFYIQTFIDEKDARGKFQRTKVERSPVRFEFQLSEKPRNFRFSFDLIPKEQCYIYLRADDAVIYNVCASANMKNEATHGKVQ